MDIKIEGIKVNKEKYVIKTLKVSLTEHQQLNSEISYITVYKSIYILSNFFAFLYGIMWSLIALFLVFLYAFL